mgnify:CR=1 FL=1
MNEPILALDFSSGKAVNQFLQHFQGKKLFVKVGMQLFYREGPAIIEHLKEEGHRLFLDLKLHDIPNTVKQAMKGLASLGVDMVNVHAAGGKRMMEAALEGLEAGTKSGSKRPICIAVTQLTSTSENVMQEELRVKGTMEEVVLHYASLAKASGLDGVVSSAFEVPEIKDKLGNHFVAVAPGIRLKDDRTDDQVRVVTPKKAKQLGCDYIVVGRSITKSENPIEAYERVKQEWKAY